MFPKTKRIVDEKLLAKMRNRNCDACNKPGPNQACHIKTRGSGGDDIESNLYTGCFECHDLQGKGWSKIFEKYPFFRQIIYNKGWTMGPDKKLRRE